VTYCTFCRKYHDPGLLGHRCDEHVDPREPGAWPCEAQLAARYAVGRTAKHGEAHGRRSGLRPGAP